MSLCRQQKHIGRGFAAPWGDIVRRHHDSEQGPQAHEFESRKYNIWRSASCDRHRMPNGRRTSRLDDRGDHLHGGK